MKTITCNYCGEILDGFHNSCPHCGAPVASLFNHEKDLKKVFDFLATHDDTFPNTKIPQIKQTLIENTDKLSQVYLIEFKDPKNMFVISLITGLLGGDRFSLDQPLIGILKLFYSIVSLIWGVKNIFFGYDFFLFLASLLLILLITSLWWLIDLITIRRRTQEWNFKKIESILN